MNDPETAMQPARVDPVELERLWALVLSRHGRRLSEAEQADLRQSVQGLLDAVSTLRQVPLTNADAPLDMATACRGPRRAQP